MPALLFSDPAVGAAQLTGGVDFSDEQALIEFFVGNAKRLGTAGKILFPIPDRRVSKRLYRIQAPTMLLWGAGDQYVPLAYAEAWTARIPGAEVLVVPAGGHMVTVEQPAAVASLIDGFVGRLQPALTPGERSRVALARTSRSEGVRAASWARRWRRATH